MVASLIKRMAHRNANVQLYTLEVIYLYNNIHSILHLLMCLVGECTVAELRPQDASRAVFEIVYRRATATGQRSRMLISCEDCQIQAYCL